LITINPYTAKQFVGLTPPDAKYFFCILFSNTKLMSQTVAFLTKV